MSSTESKEESSHEEDEPSESTSTTVRKTSLKKRGRSIKSKSPQTKKKRGRPSVNPNKNDYLLLIDYSVNTPLSFMKVDRTAYFKELHYVRSKSASSVLPPKYLISVGSVVAIWQFGTIPFVIHALTNNNGTSAIYKMVVSRVVGQIDEEVPACPNNSVQSPSDKQYDSVNVSEIWHQFNKTMEIDVETYPNHKRKLATNRKKDNKVKKEEPSSKCSKVPIVVSDSPTLPASELEFSTNKQLSVTNYPMSSRQDQDILEIIPENFFKPPTEPMYQLSQSVMGNAMKMVLQNHRHDMQILTDRLSTTIETVTHALTTTTELVSAQMSAQLEQSRASQEAFNKFLQETNKSNQDFLLKMMSQFRQS